MPILCPLENRASKIPFLGWRQIRRSADVSQGFGKDFIWTDGKLAYARFGMKGHNGIDFGVPVGTPVFAPCDGSVKVKDDGRRGYGLHIKIRSAHGSREIMLGHLSVIEHNRDTINAGNFIGYTGNSGYSTGPHLHLGLRFLNENKEDPDIFNWSVRDRDNGYYGYVDPTAALISFKGGLYQTTLKK